MLGFNIYQSQEALFYSRLCAVCRIGPLFAWFNLTFRCFSTMSLSKKGNFKFVHAHVTSNYVRDLEIVFEVLETSICFHLL
eukprot:c37679_g1_i1 orf=94-336(+)